MNKNKRYISKVLSYIECNHKTKLRLKEDLLSDIYNKSEIEDTTDPYILMGQPKNVALEIIDNYELKLSTGFEYISSANILGLPILHISSKQHGISVGVIAIGLKSIGLFSIGILSLGVLSLGVISLGLLLSVGSVTLSPIMSLGAVAISGFSSLGAIAISNGLSMGAIAIGKLAIGARAYGDLAIFTDYGSGDVIINMKTQSHLIEPAIKELYDSTIVNDFILKNLYIK